MFDIATRPPSKTASGSGLSLPFDWSLLTPTAPSAYPWSDFTGLDGVVQRGVEQLQTFALELEPTLQTAITISLFTDRRAGRDDRLPAGVTDRRGWVGDEFMNPGEETGSLMWLLYVGKVTPDVLARAKFTCSEALAWMVRTEVASRVVVDASWVATAKGDVLAVRPQIYQADQASPVYDVLWGTSLLRGSR